MILTKLRWENGFMLMLQNMVGVCRFQKITKILPGIAGNAGISDILAFLPARCSENGLVMCSSICLNSLICGKNISFFYFFIIFLLTKIMWFYIVVITCGDVGTGRQAWLRSMCWETCRFKSCSPHLKGMRFAFLFFCLFLCIFEIMFWKKSMNNYRLSKRILENWKVCGSFLKKRNWIIFIRVFLKSGKILVFYGKLLAACKFQASWNDCRKIFSMNDLFVPWKILKRDGAGARFAR